jgi:hypothetical protein
MKTRLPIREDESLRAQLRAWKVDAGLPPGFRESVWRGIERGEGRRSGQFWDWIWDRVNGWTSRPAWVLAYATAMLVFGVGLGLQGAMGKVGQWEQTTAAQYLQLVDPLQQSSRM